VVFSFSRSGDAAPPCGWVAVDTRFGDVSEPYRDYAAAQFIRRKAAASSARVVIFPESVVPRWSEATESFWSKTLNQSRRRGQILAIGAGLPAQTATPTDKSPKLNNLKAYDFSAAIDTLRNMDMQQHLPAVRSRTFSNWTKPQGEPIDNTMLIVGAESATFYQRVPVPLGMWRPFSRISVPLRLNGPGVVALDHQRAGVLICYEQLITFPILASMRQHPTVIVGISNSFWVEHTSIPLYQVNAMRSWAKLFRLPYLLAINS
jgi:apolipoprotein N-acyltransferase